MFGSLPPSSVPAYRPPPRGELLGRAARSGRGSAPESTASYVDGFEKRASQAAPRYFDSSADALSMRDRRRRRVQMAEDPKRLRRAAGHGQGGSAEMSLIPLPALLGVDVVDGDNDSNEPGAGAGGGPVVRSDFESAEELNVVRSSVRAATLSSIHRKAPTNHALFLYRQN